jgi:RecJ-like exonuclease
MADGTSKTVWAIATTEDLLGIARAYVENCSGCATPVATLAGCLADCDHDGTVVPVEFHAALEDAIEEAVEEALANCECPHCAGQGHYSNADWQCDSCGGTGQKIFPPTFQSRSHVDNSLQLLRPEEDCPCPF